MQFLRLAFYIVMSFNMCRSWPVVSAAPAESFGSCYHQLEQGIQTNFMRGKGRSEE